MEMLSTYNRQLEQQKRRSRAPKAAKSKADIFAWLKSQPDADELRAKVEKAVMLKFNGCKTSDQTVLSAVTDALWQERKRRELRKAAIATFANPLPVDVVIYVPITVFFKERTHGCPA